MRRLIIAGNWKLNKTVAESIRLANALKLKAVNIERTQMVVCPVFTALTAVRDALRDSAVALGAQNMYWEASGAYTGEISAPLLADAGCEYVILGHSERREYFGETDEGVSRKTRAALKEGLRPIVCVGETLEQRQANQTFEIVGTQLKGGLGGLSSTDMASIVVAYEPVWAIGTGLTATPDQADEVHAFMRGRLAELFDGTVADQTQIQYGGSVKPGNAADLLAREHIDGALVGGASLNAEDFIGIIKAAEAVNS